MPPAIATYVSSLQSANESLSKLTELCEAVIDLDMAPREFIVNSSFSPELSEAKEEIEALEEKIEQHHEDFNEEWSSETGASHGAVR